MPSPAAPPTDSSGETSTDSATSSAQLDGVPFFRPELTEDEIAAVVEVLRSGWLTTGPRARDFEQAFADAVGAEHAVALNSATAALHLATVALGLRRGQAVLVPTMTFAATAEVVRYADAVPILVDCREHDLSLDLDDARAKIERLRRGELLGLAPDTEVVGIMPVHVGGLMLDMDALDAFAQQHRLWIVEDAAHAFPAAYRSAPDAPWRRAGENTADVSCFSFYANKTITTGEGGMATTSDGELAEQMRSLSLHGLSTDAWGRYTRQGSWDYRILAPGYKYNLTDSAAALGLGQLERAEEMRRQREAIAHRYRDAFADLGGVENPPDDADRLHSWHLFQIRLGAGAPERTVFLDRLRERGIGTSVHWRPLHLHPYYADSGWRPEDARTASRIWQTTVSLPIFPAQRDDEVEAVIDAVRSAVRQ